MTKIVCSICGEQTHSIQLHLKEAHPEVTVNDYIAEYPNAELFSQAAKEKIDGIRSEKIKMAGVSTAEVVKPKFGDSTKAMNDVFGLGKTKAAMSAKGDPIQISVMSRTGEYTDLIPNQDSKYVYPIELLKNVLLGIETGIPTYLWGHAGVGKSTMYEQVCARTNRPYMRVQHTANTEECHIVGQILANESGTYFEPGPLALAMRHGFVYNADEYDFAHASVLAVYQPVLEGKAMLIKEAPPEWRMVEPHKDFRFVATGNTNGSGDDTGLYNGTNLGNAANYSRFGITDHVVYMDKKIESRVISSQSGIAIDDALTLVDFAKRIRDSFDSGNMTSTIGPRELIYAAKIGLMKKSWRMGIDLAFVNRLSAIDREVASGLAQRVFG